MRLPFTVLTAVFSLLAMPVGVTAAPAPDRALEPLAFFNGSWTCTESPAKGKSYTYASHVGPTEDGQFQQWRSILPPVSRPYISTDYLRWNARQKVIVDFGMSNRGDYYSQSSPGWHGNTIVFRFTMQSDGGALGTQTFHRVSPTAYTYVETSGRGRCTKLR
ncbi:MAG: hypothetical protein NVS2B17_13740 [Candidatus Velthaea sp.]